MSGSNPLAVALGQVGQTNPLQFAQGYANLATSAQQLKTGQFNLQQAQQGLGYDAVRRLQATNPNPSDADVQAALGEATRLGGNVDGLVNNYTAFRARGGTAADFVRGYSAGGMSPEAQATALTGVGETHDTGSAIVSGIRGGVYSATPGRFTPSGFIQKTLTPGEASDFVTIQTPQGPQTVTRGSLVGAGAGGGGGAATGAAPSGAAPVGGGAGAGVSPSQATYNYGNIRAPGGGFASYGSPQDGVAAMARNLTAYQDVHGINTLNGITARWAPAGDGNNNPAAYAAAISRLTGLDPNQPLDLHDPATLAKIIPAMAQIEHGRPMGIGSDVLAAGITAGVSGRGGGAVAAAPGGAQGGPFIGATSAQPVAPGGAGAPAGGGAVRPAGGVQGYDAYGRPLGAGGGGAAGGGYQGPAIPGVTYTPQGPVIRPTSPYEQPQLEQSSKDYVADQVTNRTLSRRIAPLQQAISIIKTNPGLVTGPSSENWYQWVQGIAAATGIDVGDVHNANAYQELAKQLAMNLQQSGADPSDLARLMHEASQPNTSQGKQAIVTLAAEQIGYQRLKSAQYLEFRSRHPSDANTNAQFYNQETGDWASQQDPMAYAADQIPQAELQRYLSGLDAAGQKRFADSLQSAKRLFNFKLPTQQGGQNGG